MTKPPEKIDSPPDLIIGLGNPGTKHRYDRHNVGFWFVEMMARRYHYPFVIGHKAAKADVATLSIYEYRVLLVKPLLWMNHSGLVVRKMLDYLKAAATEALIVHDDLDLPPGTARLKCGGGHGGHNGLRDIIQHCGPDFKRLRIGVGHPGDRDLVTPYVLSRPPPEEREQIVGAMMEGLLAVEDIFDEGMQAAMNTLHTPPPGNEDTPPGKGGLAPGKGGLPPGNAGVAPGKGGLPPGNEGFQPSNPKKTDTPPSKN